jgi:hypothetical protein
VDQNISIAASENNVYITWWTNKTGMLEPLFRASKDGGPRISFYFIIQMVSLPTACSQLGLEGYTLSMY